MGEVDRGGGARAADALRVVGVVASAGGLSPLMELFGSTAADCALAFVVVQHLAPDVDSVLPELLDRVTALDVEVARDGASIRPGRVYVIAPGTVVSVRGEVLEVAPRGADGSRMPGDHLLCSLARELGDRAAGVVLSGGGHDGTAGIVAIEERGGVTAAQRPSSAEHPSMPESAIASGSVELTLEPHEISSWLAARMLGRAARADESPVTELLPQICAALHRRTGHDFSRYKSGTLERRIRRRMQACELATPQEYLRHLGEHGDEPRLLLKELLVSVTAFFREPEVFESLAADVLPRILSSGPNGATRIWVPGCASGEEAYTLAILISETLERAGAVQPIQLFATDLDPQAIDVARAGRYTADAVAPIDQERLARFFTRDGEAYVVRQRLRDMCVFSTQDLVRDPPFSSLDLISCRNVLIYLQPDLQAKILPLFHYALRRGGYLLLGPSEGLAASRDLFEPVDRGKRIFRRRDVPTRPVSFSFRHGRAPARARDATTDSTAGASAAVQRSLGSAFERTIVEEIAPPCAAIDRSGNILYLAGRLARYLRPAAGPPSDNLFDQLHGSLRSATRQLVDEAASRRRRVVCDGVVVETETGSESVRVIVWPVPAVHEGLVLGVALQRLGPADPVDEDELVAVADAPRIEQLEADLRATRAELQSTIEELESANEELQSSNEELQSSNEELHTSQEELQAVNEELETVNAELHTKVQEVAAVNSDLQNLFASTPVATIFVDRDLRVTRFTPAAKSLFEFIDGDIGRPIAHLAPRFASMDYPADAREVLQTGQPVEREVRSLDGTRTFIVRSQPYRVTSDAVEGVVTTVVEITSLKTAQEAVQLRSELIELSFDAIAVWRLGGPIELWNRGAAELYGYPPSEALGRTTHELLHTVVPEPWSQIEATLRRSGRWSGTFEHRARDGRRVVVSAKLMLIRGSDGVERIFETNRDVTEVVAAARELRESEERLRLANESAGIAAIEVELPSGRLSWHSHVPSFDAKQRQIGTLEELLAHVREDDATKLERALAAARDPGSPARVRQEFRWQGDPDGSERWAQLTARADFELEGASRAATRIRGVLMDITARKQAERVYVTSQRLHSLGVLAGGIAHDFNNLLMGLFTHVSLAHEESRDVTVREYLAEALESHGRATALSHQLLTFAKGGAPRRTPGVIGELVRTAVGFALSGSNVSPRFALPADLAPCEFDRHQMARVFENITINARQAMPLGGVVEVSGGNERLSAGNTLGLAPGPYVRISIRDSGPGIEADGLEHIFDPFYTTRSTGSGLGLATVHSIVTQHDGRIQVESAVGRGSTFHVYLPASANAPAEALAAPRYDEPPRGRVLVMDDLEPLRRSIADLLTRFGCEVLVAADGEAALATVTAELAAGRTLDAALLDLTVPGGVAGKEVAERLRALGVGIPLVAMSGYSEDPVIARPREFGFADSIPKPASGAEIAATLARVMRPGAKRA